MTQFGQSALPQSTLNEQGPSLLPHVKTSGKRDSLPHLKPPDGLSPTKAAAVSEAAQNLIGLGINTVEDINIDDLAPVKKAMRAVSGIGFATTNYFLMNLV